MENLKYFGLAFRNKDWRVKKLRGNECGSIHTAASQGFALLPAF
jgi:hypothetical protein